MNHWSNFYSAQHNATHAALKVFHFWILLFLYLSMAITINKCFMIATILVDGIGYYVNYFHTWRIFVSNKLTRKKLLQP